MDAISVQTVQAPYPSKLEDFALPLIDPALPSPSFSSETVKQLSDHQFSQIDPSKRPCLIQDHIAEIQQEFLSRSDLQEKFIQTFAKLSSEFLSSVSAKQTTWQKIIKERFHNLFSLLNQIPQNELSKYLFDRIIPIYYENILEDEDQDHLIRHLPQLADLYRSECPLLSTEFLLAQISSETHKNWQQILMNLNLTTLPPVFSHFFSTFFRKDPFNSQIFDQKNYLEEIANHQDVREKALAVATRAIANSVNQLLLSGASCFEFMTKGVIKSRISKNSPFTIPLLGLPENHSCESILIENLKKAADELYLDVIRPLMKRFVDKHSLSMLISAIQSDQVYWQTLLTFIQKIEQNENSANEKEAVLQAFYASRLTWIKAVQIFIEEVNTNSAEKAILDYFHTKIIEQTT